MVGALFDHEKLEVYQLSRELNRLLTVLLDELPRGHAEPKDNLRRAGRSITRNIAEGAGKWKLPDKVHFYHIARGSATECASCLDELVDTAGVSEGRVHPLKLVLSRIVAMLVAMIRSLESRDGNDMQPRRSTHARERVRVRDS
jgi:four helix bundle protein